MAALEFATIDFDDFHRVELPRRIDAGNGALAAPDLAGVGTIAFRVPDGAGVHVRPRPRHGRDLVDRRRGRHRRRALAEAFSDFANELRTCFGLLYAGMVDGARAASSAGSSAGSPRCAPLYHGRPIIDLVRDDRSRRRTSFDLDDDDDDLRAFLETHGLPPRPRGVHPRTRSRPCGAEVERDVASATPDDGRSWWATQADGTEVCCRLIYLGQTSPLVAGLGDDPRLAGSPRSAATGLEPELDCLDGQSVVIKNPDVTAGLSDLPWHRDCGLGGHPVLCPSVAIGIQLDRGVRGDRPAALRRRLAPRVVAPAAAGGRGEASGRRAIDTEPGDVTVHFGDVLHAAPPPTGEGPCRRAMYVTFTRPETMAFIGPGNGYNDVLFEHDGQVHSVEELTP